MKRGEKLMLITVEGQTFSYRQPGWWCSLEDPDDMDGQLVDDDNLVAELALRTAEAIVKGEEFPPALVRAIRLQTGLSQRAAGEVFGGGPKSFEKYESGEIRPSEPMKRLLRLAMVRPDLFRRGEGLPDAADAALIQKTLQEARLDRLYAPLFEKRKFQAA
ncbi:MAG TPA: type II TA system antitoxin MqsA family protein [Stellaceae bacterium]|nr:type II TA system antitoxin MqsA family protein [Stellaceae bacterium]